MGMSPRAFSSEVGTGSREENAAVGAARAQVAPLNPAYIAHELRPILEDAAPSVIVYDKNLHDVVATIAKDIGVSRLVRIGDDNRLTQWRTQTIPFPAFPEPHTLSTRSSRLPSVPTLAEANYRGATIAPWAGVFAPAGTPPKLITYLSAEIGKIVAKPAVQARMNKLGLDLSPPNTPETIAAFIGEETELLCPLMNRATTAEDTFAARRRKLRSAYAALAMARKTSVV